MVRKAWHRLCLTSATNVWHKQELQC